MGGWPGLLYDYGIRRFWAPARLRFGGRAGVKLGNGGATASKFIVEARGGCSKVWFWCRRVGGRP